MASTGETLELDTVATFVQSWTAKHLRAEDTELKKFIQLLKLSSALDVE